MRRRRADLHLIRDRDSRDRGAAHPSALHTPHIRDPSVPEQAMQFLTRYLFAILGLIFFSGAPNSAPTLLSIWHFNSKIKRSPTGRHRVL